MQSLFHSIKFVDSQDCVGEEQHSQHGPQTKFQRIMLLITCKSFRCVHH